MNAKKTGYYLELLTHICPAIGATDAYEFWIKYKKKNKKNQLISNIYCQLFNWLVTDLSRKFNGEKKLFKK